MIRLFSLVIATLMLAWPTVMAAPAHAATPASVEIISPADGSSGYGTDLTVSGRARSASNWVFVTVEGDVNTYEAFVSRNTWSTHINELPAGPTTICAEVRSTAGTVLAKDCNTFTVTADPSRLAILFPEEGSVQGDSVRVVVQCVAGTAVRLTVDAGETIELPCEDWSVEHTYTGLAAGPHTVTARMVDQGVVVATQTRTFTADPRDPGTVAISSPADGSSGYVGPVTLSGTASSWNNTVYILTDGVESHTVSIDDSGTWQVALDSLGVGSHTICAAVKDPAFEVEAQECIDYTVNIDPSLLTITSPEEGVRTGPQIAVVGACAEGTTVRLSLDGGEPIEQTCTGSYTQEFQGLTGGAHTVVVTMLYDGSAVATAQRSFSVDATAPAAPVITSPSTKTTITRPTVTLVGTAEPGSTVELWASDDASVRTTTADASGSWSLTLDEAFFYSEGALSGRRSKITLTVAAVDPFGNRSATNSYTYTVHIR